MVLGRYVYCVLRVAAFVCSLRFHKFKVQFLKIDYRVQLS